MANVQVIDYLAPVAQNFLGATDETLIAAYVRAARKFCRESRWFRSTLQAQTAPNEPLYSLGSDQLLEVLGLKAASCTVNGQTYALGVGDTTGWNPNARADKPRRYAYVPEGQVAFYPTPDAAYDVTLTLVLQPKVGVVELPEELLVKYDQVIEAGAMAFLYGLRDFADPVQAQINARMFQAGIGNARADEQREYNSGTNFIRRRPFIVGSP